MNKKDERTQHKYERTTTHERIMHNRKKMNEQKIWMKDENNTWTLTNEHNNMNAQIYERTKHDERTKKEQHITADGRRTHMNEHINEWINTWMNTKYGRTKKEQTHGWTNTPNERTQRMYERKNMNQINKMNAQQNMIEHNNEWAHNNERTTVMNEQKIYEWTTQTMNERASC